MLSHRSSGFISVVTLPQSPVEENREVDVNEGDLGRLYRSAKIRNEYGGKTVIASAITEPPRLFTPRFRESTVGPTTGDTLLVVLTRRMRLKDDFDPHHNLSWGRQRGSGGMARETTHTPIPQPKHRQRQRSRARTP
jgi:hypothetical protein